MMKVNWDVKCNSLLFQRPLWPGFVRKQSVVEFYLIVGYWNCIGCSILLIGSQFIIAIIDVFVA